MIGEIVVLGILIIFIYLLHIYLTYKQKIRRPTVDLIVYLHRCRRGEALGIM